MVAVFNGTIAIWLKETLTQANIRASGVSTKKATATYPAFQGASIRTILNAIHIVYEMVKLLCNIESPKYIFSSA